MIGGGEKSTEVPLITTVISLCAPAGSVVSSDAARTAAVAAAWRAKNLNCKTMSSGPWR
jgi:hypothetical protein